jgi:hypothetical protein
VTFSTASNVGEKLQLAFNVAKGLILPKIYSNNYSKHCINKVHINGEDIKYNENQEGTNINICAIIVADYNDKVKFKYNVIGAEQKLLYDFIK